MKISKLYGPQFDSSDGTVGETQLVKRYAIVSPVRNNVNGQYTFATKAEAERHFEIMKQNNDPSLLVGYKVKALWCWPGHFDSVGLAEEV